MYYTGIGSEETPIEILGLMRFLGMWLGQKDFILRTDNRKGSSVAFQVGAELSESDKDIYNSVRNNKIILGESLDKPSKFVICYTKDGKGGGGTGQALRVARDYDIPIFDCGKYNSIREIKREFNNFYSCIKQTRL